MLEIVVLILYPVGNIFPSYQKYVFVIVHVSQAVEDCIFFKIWNYYYYYYYLFCFSVLSFTFLFYVILLGTFGPL